MIFLLKTKTTKSTTRDSLKHKKKQSLSFRYHFIKLCTIPQQFNTCKLLKTTTILTPPRPHLISILGPPKYINSKCFLQNISKIFTKKKKYKQDVGNMHCRVLNKENKRKGPKASLPWTLGGWRLHASGSREWENQRCRTYQ